LFVRERAANQRADIRWRRRREQKQRLPPPLLHFLLRTAGW
jgi:hypothetical protein